MEIILSLISYNFYFSKKLQNLTNSTSTLCFLRDPIMQQSTRYKSTYSLTNQKCHSIWLLLQPFFAPLSTFWASKVRFTLIEGPDILGKCTLDSNDNKSFFRGIMKLLTKYYYNHLLRWGWLLLLHNSYACACARVVRTE